MIKIIKGLPAHGNLPLVGLGDEFLSDRVKSTSCEPIQGEGAQQRHIEDVIDHEKRDDEDEKLADQPVAASGRMHDALATNFCYTTTLFILIQVLLICGVTHNPDLPIIVPLSHSLSQWLYVWLIHLTRPIFQIYYKF